MSRRAGVLKTVTLPAPTSSSPNAGVARITVEVRAFWPPGMGNEPEAAHAIVEAAMAAINAVLSTPAERPGRAGNNLKHNA